MPRVHICPVCKEKVTDDQDYTISSSGDFIHLQCHQNRPAPPKPGFRPRP